ncbi:MAG: hypothetical protein ABSC20_11000 [Candidatus Bathyarchaeia archaeon]|jgi:hypothetical protein
MSENNVTKEALRKKYLKKIEQDLDELKKNQTQSQSPENITFDKEKEIGFTIELIKYLTAELANTKAELWLLKQSTKEPH